MVTIPRSGYHLPTDTLEKGKTMCQKERKEGTLTIRKPYRKYHTIQKAISDACYKEQCDYLLQNGQLMKLEGILWERAVKFKETKKGKYPLHVKVTYIPTGTGFGRLESWKFVD